MRVMWRYCVLEGWGGAGFIHCSLKILSEGRSLVHVDIWLSRKGYHVGSPTPALFRSAPFGLRITFVNASESSESGFLISTWMSHDTVRAAPPGSGVSPRVVGVLLFCNENFEHVGRLMLGHGAFHFWNYEREYRRYFNPTAFVLWGTPMTPKFFFLLY